MQQLLIRSLLILLLLTSAFAPMTIAAPQTLPVTARVTASPTDFQASLATSAPEIVSQRQDMPFELTYGSFLSHPTTITLVVEWSTGNSNGTPIVDLLAYVPDSATEGYNSTQPIIDPVNRTITWTITNFPANVSDQHVAFTLRPQDNYVDTKPLALRITGRVSSEGTQTPDSTIARTFQYSRPPAPTARPISTTPVLTPTVTPERFLFRDISVEGITPESISLSTLLTKSGTITLSYGTSPTLLTQHTSDQNFGTYHLMTLPQLQKDTVYYVQIRATDTSGTTIVSRLYSIRTARMNAQDLLQPESLFITSNNVVLHSQPTDQGIVVPQNTLFSVQFHVRDSQMIKALTLSLINDSVLAAKSSEKEVVHESQMVMFSPGVYTGTVMATTPGSYDLLLTLADTNGNITQHPLTRVIIAAPFSVIDTLHNPIDHAKITLSFFDHDTRRFLPINTTVLSIQNPSFTNYSGESAIVLPNGRYRAVVQAHGFVDKTVDFTIGEQRGIYPVVILSAAPFSLITFFTDLWQSLIEFGDAIAQTAGYIAYSSRFFALAATSIVFCFVLLTFMAFTARARLPLRLFFRYLRHERFRYPQHLWRIGTVLSDHHLPLPSARVLLLEHNTVLSQTLTDAQGDFRIHVPSEDAYTVEIVHTGYISQRAVLNPTSEKTIITLSPHTQIRLLSTLVHLTGRVMGMLFEVLLVSSLGLEVLYAMAFGLTYSLPFFLLSVTNILFWFVFLTEQK